MDVGDGDPPWGDGKWESYVKSRWASVMETRRGRRFPEGLWRLMGDAFLKGYGVSEDEDEDEGVDEGS